MWKQTNKPTESPMYKIPRSKMRLHWDDFSKKKFCELYPVTPMSDMMRLFGLSEKSVRTWAKNFELTKNYNVIKQVQVSKLSKVMKKVCKDRDFSPQAREALKKKRAEGFNPVLAFKEKHPRKFKRWAEQRKKQLADFIAEERRRKKWGLDQKTNLNIPMYPYTKEQRYTRRTVVHKGYILGDPRENMGERYTIYYDKDTQRSARSERTAISRGFTIKELVG